VSFFDKFSLFKEIFNMELNGIINHITGNVRKISVRYCWKIKVFGLVLLSDPDYLILNSIETSWIVNVDNLYTRFKVYL